MDDTSEKAQRRVRMIKRDRQNINRIIQHKRDEFEQFIRNGVVSLLNTKEEQRQLAEERSDYFGFLTNRNKQKKARLNSVVNHAKGVTNSAPMGVSSAANIAFGGAGVIGEAIYNNEETHRKETEAENKLSSAQFLHYVPSTDYETIAQQVASLLSYRFQFLLFRLAAGENGYLKLANFLVESMENYAIKRFREHKGKVVNSLINAAIPPTTDAFRYIEWPLKRKKLELDEDANKILDRCGPAVRVLLGAYRERVDPVKGTIKVYKPYTILGALNHASILDTKAEVISGIETQNRKLEQLDGTKKYPMILLGLGETSAHLGVHFATKLTSQVLQGAQIEALERLVPDFFSHEVAYIAQPKLSKLEPLQVDNADLRYPNERFEVPWTATRERDWKERLKHIYEASKQVREEEEVEVVITKHPEKFAAMRFACFSFDAEQAKNDVIRVINEAANAQIAVNETDIKTVGRISKQLNAATAAKYAALAASELMHCIIKCSKLDESTLH